MMGLVSDYSDLKDSVSIDTESTRSLRRYNGNTDTYIDLHRTVSKSTRTFFLGSFPFTERKTIYVHENFAELKM